MRIAFADSTFYVALLLARDSGHGDAKALAASWTGRIVTSEYILTEVANHLSSSRFGRQKFGEFLTSIESDRSTEVVAASRDLWSRGVALYLQRADKEWSLTDRISFVIIEERGLGEALTADHHFEQAGLRALLRL